MSKHGVLRAQLIELSKQHPDWDYHQFADHLGASLGAVKMALNRLGFYITKQETYKRKVRLRIRPPELDYDIDKPAKLKPRPDHVSIASRATGYSYGYTKLI